MFNVGWGEMVVVFVVVLLVFGPNKLPEIARSMGKFMRNFQQETSRALDDLKQGVEPQKAGIFDEPDAEVTAGQTVPFAAAADLAAPRERAANRTPARRKSSTRSSARRKPAAKTRASTATPKKPAEKKPAAKKPAPKRPAAGRSAKKK